MNAEQINLNGGAISPYCAHRTDLAKHGTSLQECHNFIPMPYGGVRKRPGTRWRQTLPQATANSRLRFFQSSNGLRFMLLFCPGHFYAYDIQANSLYSQALAWPMTDETMVDLRFKAINDVIYIVSPHFHPLQLSYFGGTTWTFTALNWKFPPMQDENLSEGNKIAVFSPTPAATWTTGAAYTVGNERRDTADTREYVCIAAHTGAAINSPGLGTQWQQFWTPKIYPAGTAVRLRMFQAAPEWNDSKTDYTRGDYVGLTTFSPPRYYRAKIKSPPTGASNRPDTANGKLYWEELPIVFNSGMVGTSDVFSPSSQFLIRQRRLDDELSSTIRAISGNDLKSSPVMIVDGAWDFQTFGTWHGTFNVQRSYDGGVTWTTARSFTGAGDANYSTSGNEDESCLMRIYFEKAPAELTQTPSGGNQRATLTPRDGYVGGRVRITGFTSAGRLDAVTLETVQSGETWKWTESAFSPTRGYPSVVELHDRRLVLASNLRHPTGLWFSEVENFLNFEAGTADADSFFIVLATNVSNKIQWLASQRRLFIGCRFSEWVVGSETSDTVITPSTFRAREYTFSGSANQEALRVGDAVVFAQRNNNRLRELVFDDTTQNYASADLTRLAEHFFLDPAIPSPIRSMSWQESREPMLWLTRSDGTLLTFTYSRAENIAAWASHSTGAGKFLQTCVAPTSEQDDDEIFFLCERTGTSSNIFTLEMIPSNAHKSSEYAAGRSFPSMANPPIYDCLFYGNLSYENQLPPHPAVLNSLTRARSTQLANIGTGIDRPPNFAITGTVSGIDWAVGVPITAHLVSMPLEAATQTGSSIGRKKRMHKARAHVNRGTFLQALVNINQSSAVNATLAHWTTETMRPLDPLTYNLTNQKANALYSGWIEASVNQSGQNIAIGLRHTAPEVCTVTAVVSEYEIYQP